MKNPWVIVGALTIILFGGSIWFASTAAEKNNEGIEIKTHVLGNSESTVTLVEYSDLQCPACAAFEPAVKEVLSMYGDSIRFEYRHFPLPIQPYAVQAAVAAEAAGQQDKFFEFKDLVFTNQGTWSASPTPNIFFMQYAEELELNMEQFKRQMNSSVLRDAVQASFTEAREQGFTGTPTFVLNGQRMEVSTYQDFIDQIGAAVNPDAPSTATTETDVKFGL